MTDTGASAISQPELILASSSPYRRELLGRLGIDFTCVSPDVDEAHGPGENADSLVLRLARAKALAVAGEYPEAVVIGSDQVLSCGGKIMGKPGNANKARKQLRKMSGKPAIFTTGLCVIDPRSKQTETAVVDYEVFFRELTDEEIDRYLAADQPYHCAGSFKSECLGITLVRAMQGNDPTALIGLPLIELSRMLRLAGFHLP